MTAPTEELKEIASKLAAFSDSFQKAEFVKSLDLLRDASRGVGKAWSGSWLGYQSSVYYEDLEPPPPGDHFDMDWGLYHPLASHVSGSWAECSPDSVVRAIFKRSGDPDLSSAQRMAEDGEELFEQSKNTLTSILSAAMADSDDPYLKKLTEEVNAVSVLSKDLFIKLNMPKGQIATRDDLAASQRFRIPPHISVLGDIVEIEGPALACKNLAKITQKVFSYLERVQSRRRTSDRIGTEVFIGHGGSHVWKDLKDFVKDRLRLPWDEFNRVPVAGVTNVARLSEMLEAAAIAFIVMTAEDEQPDGKVRARMNVVHEAGLFQGRLGFSKAIVLLEEGCEEFSNIAGLGQIRFPKGNISACFEEVRRVLEREEVIEENAPDPPPNPKRKATRTNGKK